MNWFFIVVTALASLQGSFQISDVNSDTYVAAVVGFPVTQNGATLQEQLMDRVYEYVRIINEASKSDVDIIVFPESTLTETTTPQFVPDPEDEVVPCQNRIYDNNPIQNISCAALNARTYVIINLTMKRVCSNERAEDPVDKRPCGSDDLNLYNTNVVFDRTGKVISIYRKWHLFGEVGKATTRIPDVSSFKTDFGVEFGHFICFDLMFGTPANDLINRGITNFAFPTMWFSEIPFLSAVQVQQGWAYSHNVNFLGAGANHAPFGSTGSGIYAGRQGALNASMTDLGESELLISTIKKVPGSNIMPGVADANSTIPVVTLKRDWSMDNYTLIYMAPAMLFHRSLCQNEFCCSYSYRMGDEGTTAGTVHYNYFFVMYHGTRSYDGFEDGVIRVCAVVACTTDEESTCGTVFPPGSNVRKRYQFELLEVTGTFRPTSLNNSVTMPSTLTTHLLPLHSDMFSFNDTINTLESKHVNMKLSRLAMTSDMLTFGIYSQEFSGGFRTVQSIGAVLTAAILTVFVM